TVGPSGRKRSQPLAPPVRYNPHTVVSLSTSLRQRAVIDLATAIGASMPAIPYPSFRQRFLNAYRFAALTLFNTLVAFLVINALLWVAFLVKDHWILNPVSQKYGQDLVAQLYPGRTKAEVDDVLKETWSRPYIYEPFTQFKERASHGRYVNVDDN